MILLFILWYLCAVESISTVLKMIICQCDVILMNLLIIMVKKMFQYVT